MQRLHARYPFLDAAREAVEDASVDLVELVTEDDSAVVARALDRVQSALSDGEIGAPHRSHRVELLSYPVARVLVSLVDEPVLTETYARAEAAAAHERYLDDFDSSTQLKSTSAERLSLSDLLREFDLHAAVTEREAGYRIDVGRYLELASDLTDDDWRLTSRALADGQVPIAREELLTLVREAVTRRIQAGLPLSVPEPIAEGLESEVRAVRETLADMDLTDDVDVVVPELFPPSMATLLERLRDGDELSPHARFSILAFLVSIGLDGETAREFVGVEGGRTGAAIRGQLEHLAVEDGPAAYPPPSYETLAEYDVEIGDAEETSTAAHPLTFYEQRLEAAEEYTDWRERD